MAAISLIKIASFFKSSKELTLGVRSGKVRNSGYSKHFLRSGLVMGVTSVRSRGSYDISQRGEIREFSAFPFLLQ